jgi:hypothetical protein
MSTAFQHPHLTIAEDGSIRIGKSRYKVLHLAGEHYHYGWTAEELLRQHPDLRPEQVYSALAYLELTPNPVEGRDPSLSRAELLKRRSAKGV